MGIFADYAWQYYMLGMNVMPVQDRLPLVKGFNELWYDKRQSEEEIQHLVDVYGDANGIAVVCGHFTTVLDVDCNDEKLISLAPRTPMKRFGSKGMGFIYRGAPIDKKQPGSVPLELFGRGYVVLPPSFHPKNDSHYKWIDTTFTHVEDLPEFPFGKWDELLSYCIQSGISKKSLTKHQGFSGDEGGRNIKLTAVAWAMAKNPANVSKSISTLVDEIMAFDEATHSPPWFHDPQERRHRSPREFATSFITRTLRKAAKDLSPGTVFVPTEIWNEPEEHHEVEVKKGELPPLPKGGLMEAIGEMVTAINGYENDVFSYAAALSICSILAGHKISVGSMGHPNIFVLCTAPSGSGKSAPQTAIKQALLQSATGASLIGFDSYSSSQAITYNLPTHRKRIDIIDECKQIFMDNANQRSHLAGLDGELCKVFSASAGFLPAKAAINKDSRRVALQNPYLTLCMFSTPSAFYKYFSTMLAEEGFGGRCLYLSSKERPATTEKGLVGFSGTQGFDASQLSSDALDRINNWLRLDVQYVNAQGQVCVYSEGGAKPRVYQLGLTDAAKVRLTEIQKHYSDLMAANEDVAAAENHLLPCFNRAIEQIYKLIGCWVVSQKDETHVIDCPEVEWAWQVYEYSLGSLRELLHGAEVNGDGDSFVNRYTAWARNKDSIEKKYFTRWLSRALKTKEMREINNAILFLVDQGLGHFEESDVAKGNGKRRSKWLFTVDE